MTAKNYGSLKPSPLNWKWFATPAMPAEVYPLGCYKRIENGVGPLSVILTVDYYGQFEPGAGDWLHMSVTRSNRLPSWEDLVIAREELGFKDRMFVQLLPPTKYWLNVHKYCLHLFSRMDGDTVPRILYDQEGATGENYRKDPPLPNGK
jgi:hypothetical protein